MSTTALICNTEARAGNLPDRSRLIIILGGSQAIGKRYRISNGKCASREQRSPSLPLIARRVGQSAAPARRERPRLMEEEIPQQ